MVTKSDAFANLTNDALAAIAAGDGAQTECCWLAPNATSKMVLCA